jgi:creatinine amidohydrolase
MRIQGLLSLADLTTEEAREAWKGVKAAILPVGSNEQHGPNLEMSTDSTIAAAFADRLARKFYPRVVLCPTMPYGISPHHMAFTGTMTLRPETFDAVVMDLAGSLAHHGLKSLLIVNGHGGNQGALSVITAKLRDQGFKVASLAWFVLAADEAKKTARHTPYNHACEVETSLAMALAPQLVRKEKLQPGKVKPLKYPNTSPDQPKVEVPYSFADMTENGALGDARLATKEDGDRIANAVLDRASAFLESFLS